MGRKSIVSKDMMVMEEKEDVECSVHQKEEQESSSQSGELGPFRNKRFKDKLLTYPGEELSCNDPILNMSQFLHFVTQKYSKQSCIGYRPLVKVNKKTIHDSRKGTDKKWYTPHYAYPSWITFEQFWDKVKVVARGLKVFTSLERNSFVGIFEETCQEWMTFAHACFLNQFICITCYANLGHEGLESTISETNLSTLFVNKNMLTDEFERNVIAKSKTLKFLVFNDEIQINSYQESNEDQFKDMLSKLKDTYHLKIISFKDLVRLGQTQSEEKMKEMNIFGAKPNDLALIMYTSGTTGKPKGVQITHQNLLSSIAGLQSLIIIPEDMHLLGHCYLAHLPLAHIMEIVAEHVILFKGGAIAYGSPRTLVEGSAIPCGDFDAFSPTLTCVVPKIFEKMQHGILQKIGSLVPDWCFRIFTNSLHFKMASLHQKRDTPLLDLLIFNHLKRKVFGDRMIGILCGGSPLSKELHEFVRSAFCINVIQGYGLTETCASATFQIPFKRMETEKVGVVVPCVEIKLVSIPEMGYTVHDTPNPRGEIAMRGPCVTKGYYKGGGNMENFKDDGYFLSGDIAEIDVKDGTFMIIDRKKNLVKLPNGEYVALEKIESVYLNSPFISNLMVLASNHRDDLAALIIPDHAYLKQWKTKQQIYDSEDEEEINRRIKNSIMESMDQKASEANLKTHERVKKIHVLYDDEWTTENGMMTAAQKLRRSIIQKKYNKQITDLFSESSTS